MENSLDTILAYHQRTKHHLNRYAAGPGGLDWKNQPDPFRNFTSSPQLELHLLADEPHRTYTDLYKTDETTREPLTLSGIAALLELSFGIPHGSITMARAGPCAAIPPAVICTPLRLM